MFKTYNEKLRLLIEVISFVAKQRCFAMHGGTAINLFVCDMPRLSVDIDLTYLPIEDRQTTLSNINEALRQIKDSVENKIPNSYVRRIPESGKLVIHRQHVEIKIEANLVKRGSLSGVIEMPLCNKAQLEYGMFAIMPIVPLGQLYGGKICAALDRQHPRDLFDIKVLLEQEGFSDRIRKGFLFCLVSGERPFTEMLAPNFKDQRQTMKNQFVGMTNTIFTYEDFEQTRSNLVKTVNQGLTRDDKDFLLSFKNCEPNWNIYNFEHFPAVQWKLNNLLKLKKENPQKHNHLFDLLKKQLQA